eukprot:m.170985 g.170985  ORF g.170985 m.170985 type:complete len:98 (+) comp39047_c0_seq40:2635-2928(+)
MTLPCIDATEATKYWEEALDFVCITSIVEKLFGIRRLLNAILSLVQSMAHAINPMITKELKKLALQEVKDAETVARWRLKRTVKFVRRITMFLLLKL